MSGLFDESRHFPAALANGYIWLLRMDEEQIIIGDGSHQTFILFLIQSRFEFTDRNSRMRFEEPNR